MENKIDKFGIYRVIHNTGKFNKNDVVTGYQSKIYPGHIVLVDNENIPQNIEDIQELGILKDSLVELVEWGNR